MFSPSIGRVQLSAKRAYMVVGRSRASDKGERGPAGASSIYVRCSLQCPGKLAASVPQQPKVSFYLCSPTSVKVEVG